MREYSNARNLAKRILLLVIISMLFLTATKSQAEQVNTISIQTNKAQYTIGESVEVSVSVPDIKDYKLYYEYEGFEQRYMGDYTSFSFVPRGIGIHYLVLRTRANKEVERHSFELIEAEEPPEELPEEEPEVPIEEPQVPEEPEPEPIVIPEPEPIPEPLPKTKPGLRAVKQSFKQQEDAEFEFEYEVKEKIDFAEKLKQKGTWQTPREEIIVELVDSEGEKQAILPEIERLEDGKFKIKVPKQRAIRPGLYGLTIELTTQGMVYVEEEKFLWGVLAVNTHKSIYLPGEEAFIGMAVLDNQGHMVCNADVTLQITDPNGVTSLLSTSDGTIKVSDECSVYGVTNLPDYYTNFLVGGVGNYTMNLTAITDNGVRSLIDSFIVQQSVEFDVARNGATRIYPFVPYIMEFTIRANQDYSGTVIEYVPAGFEITPQDGLTIAIVNDTKILTWNADLVAGQKYILSYEFDAPDLSPYLFTLGPLEIGSWKEARNWMIASDADTVADINVTSCIYGGCSAAGYNSNDTVSSGAVIAKDQYDLVNMSNTSFSGDAIIGDVWFHFRWYNVNNLDDHWDIELRNDGAVIDSCALVIPQTDANEYVYNKTNVTSCTTWTKAKLDDLQIYIYNDDSGQGQNGDVKYVDILITSNDVPTLTTALDDTPDSLYAGSPINYTVTGTDPNGDDYRLTVCDSDGISHGYPGTCSGNELCNSSATASGVQASCNYTTTADDVGTLNAYGFLCDAGSVKCNSTSTDESTTVNSPVSISEEQASPGFVRNGSTVNISANITYFGGGAIDEVIARIYYPNGTSAVNYTMTNSSADIYWNASYTVDFGIPGQYNVTIFANDTGGVSNTALVNFTPILNLTNKTDIVVNGSFLDWGSVPVVSDAVGDAGSGGETVIDNELLITGLGSDHGNISIFAYNNDTGNYDIIWSVDSSWVTNTAGWGGGEAADVTHDGVNDFVIARGTTTDEIRLEVWSNVSNTSWELTWNKSFGTNLISVADIADFDNDTYLEIMIVDRTDSPDEINFYGNDTDEVVSSFSEDGSIAGTSNILYIKAGGDLNNNDIPEVIFQGNSGTDIQIYEWNGTAYEWQQNVTDDFWVDDMECNGDLNNDSVNDCILCGNGQTSSVLTYNFTTQTYFIAYNTSQTPTAFSYTQTCSIADLTNDGYADWFDSSLDGPRVFSYQGGSYKSIWNLSASWGTLPGIGTSFAGDADNDGYIEFLSGGDGASAGAMLFENDTEGATSFNNSINFTGAATSNFHIIIADLDGDSSSGSGGGDNFDITNYSLAHNATYLFARLAVNGSIDFSDATQYYGLYISTNSSTGNSTSYGGDATLPFSTNYFVMVNGTGATGCGVYNSSYDNIGTCNMSNNSNTIELSVNLTLINTTAGDVINITFETGGSSYDFGPDSNSFLEFKINASGAGAPAGDSTPPTVNINVSLNGSFTNNTSPTVDFNFTDAGSLKANCTLYFNDTAYNITNDVDNKTWTDMTVNDTLSPANYSVFINCTDNASNEGKSGVIWIVVDNVTPNVYVEVPADNNWTTDNTPDFVFNVTDGFSSRLNCTLWVDGSVNGSNASTLNDTSTTITSSGLSQGSHTWTINCSDNASNMGASTARTITVDNRSPVIYIESPVDGNWTNDNQSDFVFNVSDGVDGFLNCSLWVDGSVVDNNASTLNDTSTTLSPGSDLSDGVHTWTVNCSDNASNINGSVARTITVDAGAPVVSPSSPGDNAFTSDLTPDFVFTVTDGFSSRLNCTLWVDGTVNGSNVSTMNNTATTIVSSGLSEGSHSWTVNCSDNVSNTGATTARTLYVDNTAPTVNINVSLNRTFTNNTSPLVDFNFTDALSGTANCTLYFDGTAYNITNDVSNSSQTDLVVNDTLGAGNYSVYVNCTDKAGKVDKSGVIWLVVDDVSPSVSPSSPGDNAFTSDLTPDFVFTVTDGFSSRLNCTLWVDGTVNGSNVSTMNNTATTIVSSGLSEGSHSWTVNCSDNVSNTGATTARTLYVDNTAPAVNINVSWNNTETSDTTPTIGFNFTDALSSTANCTLFFNDTGFNITNDVGNASWTDMTANDTISDGRYDVYINCTDKASNIDKSGVLNISVNSSAGNNPPVVNNVSSNASYTPNAEAVKAVEINFTVTDTNGVSDLNHSSAQVVVNKSGVTRTGNCSNNTVDDDTVEYNCSVDLQHYDSPGTWDINVSIRDNSDEGDSNATTDFTYNTLIYIQVSPTYFGFGDYYPNATYQNVSSNPLLIDNMGNVNLSQINITAYNLVNGSSTFDVSNITVNVSDAQGTALQNNSEIYIPAANVSMDTSGGETNESLYFFIRIPNLPPLTYESSSSWVITASD